MYLLMLLDREDGSMKKGKRLKGKENNAKVNQLSKNNKTDISKDSKRKQKNSISFNINHIFIIIFSIILIVSCSQIVMWYVNTKKDEQQYQELVEEVFISNTIDTSGDENIQTTIDFEKLLNINKDVVGWITIDDTNINYPILKSNDNDYYLKRDINKNISKSGSIFLDYRNNGFSDKNTVIYGHNMKNGTMFSQLKRIYNNELGTDIKIKIYTPEDNKVYKVFSTYIIKPEDFKRDAELDELQKKSKIDFGVTFEEDEKILTLFTCTDSTVERIIVHAVLE